MFEVPYQSTYVKIRIWYQILALHPDGAAKEIEDMIRKCFSMDGTDPIGEKVGLLDRCHHFCILVDPYGAELCSKFDVGNVASLMRDMIDMYVYVPLDEDESSDSRERIETDFIVRCVFT